MPVLERTNAVIVAGAGGAANLGGAIGAATPAILINSGDVVIALGFIPTTTSAFSITSNSNPNWQLRFFASVGMFFCYLWTLENPVPANEGISFSRPVAGAGFGVVQVYGRVGRIANVVQATAVGTQNPSLSPAVTTTVPGSMVVGGFAFNRGYGQTFTPSGQRIDMIGQSNSALLADQIIATPSTAQIAIPFTTSTPSGFQYFSASVVLEPATVTPPVPPGSVPAIVDEIKQWRLQAQANKIHVMPPAQRAAALAQHRVLAQQLKQAQIAQRGG